MAKKKDNKSKIQTVLNRDDVKFIANVDESYIFTTEDKIKILFNEFNEARKYSGEFWTFLGLFVSFLVSVLTCEFKDVWILSSSVIEAGFILATAITFVLCIVSAVKWMVNRKKLTFDYFINCIRGDNCNESNR